MKIKYHGLMIKKNQLISTFIFIEFIVPFCDIDFSVIDQPGHVSHLYRAPNRSHLTSGFQFKLRVWNLFSKVICSEDEVLFHPTNQFLEF